MNATRPKTTPAILSMGHDARKRDDRLAVRRPHYGVRVFGASTSRRQGRRAPGDTRAPMQARYADLVVAGAGPERINATAKAAAAAHAYARHGTQLAPSCLSHDRRPP